MKDVAIGIVSVLCVALIGCLVVPIPGNPLGLATKSRPNAPTALLPVGMGQVQVSSKEWTNARTSDDPVFTAQGCARDLECALGTLARGSDNPLVPPRTVTELLKGMPEADALWIWLGNPEIPGQDAALASVAERLGTRRVVRLCATQTMSRHGWEIWGQPCPIAGILLYWWGGNLEVTAELWDLCPPVKLASSKATAVCWGSYGNPLFYVGHAVWRPSSAAATEATREALTKLFATPLPATVRRSGIVRTTPRPAMR